MIAASGVVRSIFSRSGERKCPNSVVFGVEDIVRWGFPDAHRPQTHRHSAESDQQLLKDRRGNVFGRRLNVLKRGKVIQDRVIELANFRLGDALNLAEAEDHTVVVETLLL